MSANLSLPAVDATDLVFRYGDHLALDGFGLRVEAGELFALLGPNGSGKTTFFRLLSTLVPPSHGSLRVFGMELPAHASAVRATMGVVFQHASCDRKLTVRENLRCQAALFGLRGQPREKRIDEVSQELGFADRLDWLVEKLSGGLERRVDIAKSMLHAPRLLVLDEPSTGLDPAARLDLWHALIRLRDHYGVTILLTTHLLEEADKAERIGIMHRGKLAAVGHPNQLRSQLGQRVLIIESHDPQKIVQWLAARGVVGDAQSGQIRVTDDNAALLVAPLAAECGPSIHRLSLSEPSLEDVFVARTGHRFWDASSEAATHTSEAPSDHPRKGRSLKRSRQANADKRR